MKFFSFIVPVLLVAVVSINVRADSNAPQKKYKAVAVKFDEQDVKMHDARGPASEVEKVEYSAQKRSYARINRDDWSKLQLEDF